MEKQELRQQCKRQRALSHAGRRAAAARTVLEEGLKELNRANVRAVFAYAPSGTELDVMPLVRVLWDMDVPVAFPRVSGRAMDFYFAAREEELTPGSFGIREPEPAPNRLCVPGPGSRIAVLCPGLAFTREGKRLGYGGGYYDRYFSRYQEAELYKIGVCYREQLLAELPSDPHDIRMDRILSEDD